MKSIKSFLQRSSSTANPPLSTDTSRTISTTTTTPPTVKTRICIISDTHTRVPNSSKTSKCAYREPFPTADILIHCGDITSTGLETEYEEMLDFLKQAKAELKLVIAGNHDITLHEELYLKRLKNKHNNVPEDVGKIREMWIGEEARRYGIVYLEEGTRMFELGNGARFAAYSSPWQPEYFDWAFTYPRNIDRFNPSQEFFQQNPANPVPNHGHIDIMLTHGPPMGIRDETFRGKEHVGCDHLRRAVERCKPRIHCFGHIHEGWGAERMDWKTGRADLVEVDGERVVEERGVYLDLSSGGGRPLKWNEETMFINASIMNVHYRPENAPFVVDVDLPTMEST